MDKSEKAKQLFFDGINLVHNQNFEDAEKKFLESLELVANKYSVLDNLTVVRITLNKNEKARESAQQSIKLNPTNPVAWQNLGLVELAEDKIKEAILCFDQCIKLDPLFVGPLNNKAICLSSLNLDEQAIECCDKAIKIKSDFFEALNNKGDILKKLKKFSEAISAYEQSILIKKDHPVAYKKKADLLCDLKRYEEAVLLYDQSINIKKDSADAWGNKSLALEKMERYQEALQVCIEAIKINDNLPELWINKSLMLLNLKNFKEAIDAVNIAILKNENFAEAWNNKGLALVGLKNYEEAIFCYDKAIKLSPSNNDFLLNKSQCLYFLKKYEEAINESNKMIALNPDYAKAYLSKAQSLTKLNKIDEAITNFHTGLKKDPENVEGQNNLGLAYYNAAFIKKDNKFFSLAKEAFDQTLKLKPTYYESYYNKSLVQLTLGEFHEGWKNYEYRLKVKKDNSQVLRFDSLPLASNLEIIKDKVVIVWSEQGLGDAVQFCRFIPKISQLCKKVIFEVPKILTKLMSDQFNCEIVEKGSAFTAKIDYQIAMVSLPGLFNTNIDNIPFKQDPYIKTVKNKNLEWKKKLNLTYDKPNIGIAFSGNADYSNDQHRSTSLNSFFPLIGKANIFLLQKDIKQKDDDFLKQYPEIKFIGKDIDDFEDLASVIENMDYVISTDTSIPHLSAALGKKTYLLLSSLPDWRWLSDINYSPWYSSMNVIRKNNIFESWEDILKKIIKDLGI